MKLSSHQKKYLNQKYFFFFVALLALIIVAGAVFHKTKINNCRSAKAHGLQNIPADSKFYKPSLDRDSDGIACEA